MIVCPYNESHILLILQIDHSRIAGLLAAHWGNSEIAGLHHTLQWCWQRRNTMVAGRMGDQTYGQPGRQAARLYRQHQTFGPWSLAEPLSPRD